MLSLWLLLTFLGGFALADSGVMVMAESTSPLLPASDPVGALDKLSEEWLTAGSCDIFEELGENVEEQIDGLLEVVDRFGLILETKDVDIIKSIGCSGGA